MNGLDTGKPLTEEFLESILHQLRFSETKLSCVKSGMLLQEIRRLQKLNSALMDACKLLETYSNESVGDETTKWEQVTDANRFALELAREMAYTE